MEDDIKKKPYTPFPDEEDKNTLVSEGESEPTLEDTDAMSEQTAVQPMPESIVQEEAADEVEEIAEAQIERRVEPEPKLLKPRSWAFAAVALAAGLVAVEIGLGFLAKEFFWTVRTAYVIGMLARLAVILAVQYFWFAKRLERTRPVWYTVFGCIGFTVGIAAACLRFVAEPQAWTFINLIIEPVDSTLLALGAAYIVLNINVSNPLKQTV